MKIIKNIEVPTGNILIVQGDKGKLELVSLGDYGKARNVKADFLGYKKKITTVPHGEMLPLSKKWVVTISTQYGCDMNCQMCDVPKVGHGYNVTVKDLIQQVLTALQLHPEIKKTERLNIHYARMGEPTFNDNILIATDWFKEALDDRYKIHPVISTMMPKRNKHLQHFIDSWMNMKNEILQGNAGLQISMNTTDENIRKWMFSDNALTLQEISEVMKDIIPVGRKITLNFASDLIQTIDPNILLQYFNPDHYLIKITPIHETQTARQNILMVVREGLERYWKLEQKCIDAGYDVIVFFPSLEEDLGKITCGNAILSDWIQVKNK